MNTAKVVLCPSEKPYISEPDPEMFGNPGNP
jgi:hypothetical protein